MKFISRFFYVLPSKGIVLIPWFLAFFSASVLEVLGIGIVGPFIGLASYPELVHKNYWISWFYKILGFHEENKFIALVGLFVIVVFSFKSLVSWYIQSSIFKFGYLQKERLVARLMHNYMIAPYTLYIQKNTAQAIQNVIYQTKTFADSILNPIMVAVSNLLTIIAISILLCFVSPLTVISIVFIITPIFFLFNAFKDKVKEWGQELYQSDQEIIRGISHGLGSFKETRVIGCADFFEKETVKQSRRYADASIKFYAFKLSPRFIVEALLVICVVSFTSISLLFTKNIQQLTPVLSVFALASIRLIPSLTNFANCLSTVRNSSHSLNQLYQDLKELETEVLGENQRSTEFFADIKNLDEKDNQTMSFGKEITLKELSYQYPKANHASLDGMSLVIPKGQSIALIGRSGAGKTTLVDVLLGLLTPQQGDIQVDGVSIYQNLRAWQNLIGYIPQTIFLIDDTIERNIAFGVADNSIDQQRLERVIKMAQLTDVIDDLPDGIKTRVGERGIMLSGGQRQRVGIARALYHEREILVLDEATSALDNETEVLVTDSIKSLSGTKTMVIIAHRLTTVEHCDQIYMLDKGKVIKSGSYKEVVLEDSMLTDSER